MEHLCHHSANYYVIMCPVVTQKSCIVIIILCFTKIRSYFAITLICALLLTTGPYSVAISVLYYGNAMFHFGITKHYCAIIALLWHHSVLLYHTIYLFVITIPCHALCVLMCQYSVLLCQAYALFCYYLTLLHDNTPFCHHYVILHHHNELTC